jgi:formylglycine-generating enzyme required for sulfatase activity
MKTKFILITLLLLSVMPIIRAQNTSPEGCATAKRLGQSAYEQGEYDNAKRHFNLALLYCGDDPSVKEWISKCNTAIEDPFDNLFPMVFVEGGTFTMGCTSEQGSDCDDDEKPAHEVTLSSYYIGKTEVTQGQWSVVMGKGDGKGDYPIYGVSWNDIQEFLERLNGMQSKYTYRLPAEAEWEYAARGGNRSKGYKYSGSNTVDDVAWYTDNSGDERHLAGQKQSNELGIYDMSGNVYEWCNDRYGAYGATSQTNPDRIYRGGAYSGYTGRMRTSARNYASPDFRAHVWIGFRLARSPR